MELNEKKVTFEELKDLFLNGPNYDSWTLVTDEFFYDENNMDRITLESYGYCILDGRNRVDVWNPDYPHSDIFKKQRELFNSKNNG